MNGTILFVDDETAILESLKRQFSDTPYRVLTASGGEDALKILEHEPVDLILSDVRMPGIDGISLLRTVKLRYPGIIRVLISGQTDESVAVRAINGNLAKLFVNKPWDDQLMLHTVDQIFLLERDLKNLNLYEDITRADDLPTLNSIYQSLCYHIENESPMDDIAHVIEQDQSIATRVLRVANSAFFNIKTSSIRQSIMYLGLSNIKNIVLTSTVFESLGNVPGMGPIKDMLWRNAGLTSRIMGVLCERFSLPKSCSDNLSAGLLHDVGKIIMLKKDPGGFKKVYHTATTQKIEVMSAERNVFGFSHTDMGGYLLNWWELPYTLVESAAFHHIPSDPKIINRELVALVHLADYFSWKKLMPDTPGQLDPVAAMILNMDLDLAESWIQNIPATDF